MGIKTLVGAACLVAIALSGSEAKAAVVNATLSAQYFEVADHSDSDFNVGSIPTVANGSGLGINGLPLGTGVNDLSNGQITWWSPSLNSNVKATGTGTISLPYSSNMFAPNSTGGGNGAFFETAIFNGSFTLSSAGVVSFTLGSDDDSFIYVDGVLIGQNPGVHGNTVVQFDSSTLLAGDHSLEVFYADRQNTQASLSLNLLSTDVVITPGVPEASTWAMMILGFCGLGFMGYRRKSGFMRLA